MWAGMGSGYQGPPPLTGTAVLTSWTVDWPAIVVIVLLGSGYALALRRSETHWPRARVGFLIAGLVSVVLVRMSFLGVYSDVLFWPRAVQNVVLLMVTPLLLALSAPLSLILASVPEAQANWLRRLGRGKPAQVLTFPLVVTGLLAGPLLVLYLTPVYELSLRHPVLGGLIQVGLVSGGFVYFWTRLQIDPTPRKDPHLVSLWISLTEVIFDGVLGLVLVLGPLAAPDYYAALHRPWGPSLRMDQVIGAGVLWIGGDLAGLPFVGALINQWRRDDSRQATEIDRELDEQQGTEATTRPWWEDDPVLAERFRHH